MSIASLFRRRTIRDEVTDQLSEHIQTLEKLKEDLKEAVDQLKLGIPNELGEFQNGTRTQFNRSAELGPP